MATTNVLLREDIDTLGGRGEIVKVRAGYARNYLLPRGIALLATKGNVKQVEQERAALLKKAAVEKSTAEAQAEQMQGIALSFERKAGEQGVLFGSVTTMDIAEALKEKGYEFDRRRIMMKDAIKETGEYKVNVKLHREVILEIPITVTGEGGEMPVKEEKPKKESKKVKEEVVEEAVEVAPAAVEEPVEGPETEVSAEPEPKSSET